MLWFDGSTDGREETTGASYGSDADTSRGASHQVVQDQRRIAEDIKKNFCSDKN